MTATTFETASSKPVRGFGQYGGDVLVAVRRGFGTHSVLYTIAFLCYFTGIIECLALGLPVSYSLISIVSGTTLLFLGVIIGGWLAYDHRRRL